MNKKVIKYALLHLVVSYLSIWPLAACSQLEYQPSTFQVGKVRLEKTVAVLAPITAPLAVVVILGLPFAEGWHAGQALPIFLAILSYPVPFALGLRLLGPNGFESIELRPVAA